MGEYISRLASIHDVYKGELIEGLFTAREKGKSSCGSLFIECRKKTKAKSVFLIMKGSDVVAQIAIPTSFLLDAGGSLMSLAYSGKSNSSVAKKTCVPQSYYIRDLRAGMKNIKLKARILEVMKPGRVHTRFGNVAIITKVLIGDETGKIQLCLWNEQGENLHVGETIIIEDAKASRFGDKTQLSIGANGKLYPETSATMISCYPPELQT